VALASARRTIELVAAEPGWATAQAYGSIVQSHLLRGDPAAAGPFLEQMRSTLTRETLFVAWSYLFLSADRSQQTGDLQRAAAGYQAALDQIGERGIFARHQAWVAMSAIALERNHLTDATSYLDQSREAQRLSGRTYRAIQAAALLQRAQV